MKRATLVRILRAAAIVIFGVIFLLVLQSALFAVNIARVSSGGRPLAFSSLLFPVGLVLLAWMVIRGMQAQKMGVGLRLVGTAGASFTGLAVLAIGVAALAGALGALGLAGFSWLLFRAAGEAIYSALLASARETYTVAAFAILCAIGLGYAARWIAKG